MLEVSFIHSELLWRERINKWGDRDFAPDHEQANAVHGRDDFALDRVTRMHASQMNHLVLALNRW
jgi:hypothetical protein